MRPPILALVVFWLCGFPAQAADKPLIESFNLSNGMEVLVIPNHRIPAVSHMLWFRVGAGDDPPLASGLAHFHEHLMFQGTANYKPGEYADIIARHGGQTNAFTGHDATAYYANITKENLPLAMELEADRLRGLTATDENAEREREVIIEERRERIENNPQALFTEQMDAALYLNHPYHIPVIGWMHEMKTLTRESVMELHRTYYQPGNAILIVSGDITAKELKPLAEKYYGGIPGLTPPKREWKEEPPQRAARRITMTHPNVTQPQWLRSYLAPGLRTGETAQAVPLYVLEHVLGGGRLSRLYQALVVRQKIASGASASYDGMRLGPGEFNVSVVPAAGIALSTIESAVDAELKTMVDKGITQEELARAKTLLKADTLYDREGLQSMAYTLGWLRAIGLPAGFYDEWPERIDAVTAEQVQEAARAVFDLRHSVTGELWPEPKEKPDAK